jgi:hypothetical protein
VTQSEPSIATRALGLFTISVIVPLASVLLIDVVLIQLRLTDVSSLVSYAMVVAGTMSIYLLSRHKPDRWRISSVLVSGLLVLFVAALLVIPFGGEEPKHAPAGPTVAAVGVVTLGLVVLNLILSDQAIWLVLNELSDDVVNSSLIIIFKSRADRDTVHVTPDSVYLIRSKAPQKYRVISEGASYALADISAVTVRRQSSFLKYFPVPGLVEREVRVSRGEYVEIDVPGGTFAFPAKDCQRFARFVEDRRRALVREE